MIPPRESSARPISPSKVLGVQVISNELYEEATRDFAPGKSYAKLMIRWLGPFDNIPLRDILPKGEYFFIVQDIKRINTKLVQRMVTQLDC
ncbi:hypothetical protein GCK32_017850 [Trichostrongylus colubriformis]|uniref:Uncharacterized protein n=1 Tax=Trichostrongylus colubriformis TaxID=6319 RepID=A0AAN8IRW5_TRICO